MLQRLAKRAGIEKRVHPHGLRHSFAYQRVMEGVPIVAIQGDLGHSSSAVTDKYLNHLAPKERIERGRQDRWTFEG